MVVQTNKDTVINIILGIILGTGLYAVLFQFFLTLSERSSGSSSHLSGVNYPLIGGLIIFIIFFVLILLILNKRLALTIGGWFLILSIYLSLLISNQNTQDLFTTYANYRNIFYLIFLPYLPAHLLIHGTLWLIKRQRQVFTKTGIINYILIFLTATFAYSIISLI